MEILASELAARLATENGWLAKQTGLEKVVDSIVLDGEFAALDVGIHLRNSQMPRLSLRLFDRVMHTYPGSDLAMYNAAVVAASLLRHEQSKDLSGKAVRSEPERLDYRSLYIRTCAIAGQCDSARDALQGAIPRNLKERQIFIELAQFVDFCEKYPLADVKSVFGRIQERGSYLEPRAVSGLIMNAVAEKRPFSMVRLGDGEGAWLTLDVHDEGRFNAIYTANRASFLHDWFGSDRLINDEGFNAFSQELQRSFLSHDLIGIPPLERLEQEEGFLSVRGISSSINVFRLLDVSQGGLGYRRFCSNSINLALAAHTGFYRDLFNSIDKVGLITSQRSLSEMIKARGKKVAFDYLIPGDSRNFHVDNDGKPECQFPDHVNRIDAELRVANLSGVCFLVAAGFVGKRYLHTIREQGGIAIDLGALADHWARTELPA